MSGFVKQAFEKPAIYLILVVVVYIMLLLPTVGRYGILHDEQTDANIAHSYIFDKGGWIIGTDIDASQTRLPMYFVAIIFSLLKTSSLLLARLVSCLMGTLTIVAVYIFCKRQYDYKKGLLACFLIATSPFFLSFARIAYTESDIFVTCALSWSLVCICVLQEKRTVGWAIITAIVLGLAVSSKFTAVAIFPAVFLYLMLNSRNQIEDRKKYITKMDIIVILSFLSISVVIIFGVWAIAYFSTAIKYTFLVMSFQYFLLLFLWIIFVIWLIFHRKFVMRPLMLVFFVITFSLLTFFVLPPVHTTNPLIFKTLICRFLEANKELNLSFVAEATAFRFGCVLFKSSLIIGAWFWVGLFMTIIQSRYRKEVRLPLLIFAFYFVLLAVLPVAQTFYMMPLLPILAIFASDQFFRLYIKKRFYAKIMGFLAMCLLIIDMLLCYPDYNLNGFQWLGAKYLWGRSTIGYGSIVQITPDGIEQALKWANNNIREGETLFTYIAPRHIILAVCPDARFQIIDGLTESKTAFINADYVITSMGSEIQQGFGKDNPKGNVYKYPYDIELLKASFTKVFSVKRAFGIEVASVWRKNLIKGEVKSKLVPAEGG